MTELSRLVNGRKNDDVIILVNVITSKKLSTDDLNELKISGISLKNDANKPNNAILIRNGSVKEQIQKGGTIHLETMKGNVIYDIVLRVGEPSMITDGRLCFRFAKDRFNILIIDAGNIDYYSGPDANRLMKKSLRSDDVYFGNIDYLNSLEAKIEECLRVNNSIVSLLKSMQEQNYCYNYSLNRVNSQDDDSALFRMYSNFPKAKGLLKEVQKANLMLLKRFDERCREAGSDYFLMSETISDCVIFGGFSPWSDEIDVGMTVNDLKKLEPLMNDEPDIRLYKHYIMYKTGPREAWSIRFKDYDYPHIDIYLFDECKGDPDIVWGDYLATRKKINEYCGQISGNPNKSEERFISKLIAECRPESYDSEEGSSLVIWSLYNPTRADKMVYSKESVFPVKRKSFENIEISIPADYDMFIDSYEPESRIKPSSPYSLDEKKANMIKEINYRYSM